MGDLIIKVVRLMRYRSSRGSRRNHGVRPVIQSQKMQVLKAEAANIAATKINTAFATGTDCVAAGQTSNVDTKVPTGAHIQYVEIQYTAGNLVAISSNVTWCIQLIHTGQSTVDPLIWGGNAQRNQIFKCGLMSLGKEQSNNRTIKFKIPKQFQRVREGDQWSFTRNGTALFTDMIIFVYKYYR